MNKILMIIRYILTIVMICLLISFELTSGNYDGGSWFNLINNVIVIILVILFIKDIIKKDSINKNIIYNIIIILTCLTYIFIFARAQYDKSLIYNDKKVLNEYVEVVKSYEDNIDNNTPIEPVDLKEYKNHFILQNMPYYVALELLILIYRKINLKKYLS